MDVLETKISGCYIIERDFFNDERGYFSRIFCRKTLSRYNICTNFVQSNLSANQKKYTLRGLHSQEEPYSEDKLVICTCGKILDVCVDVRKDSPTYKQYVSFVLDEKTGKGLYIPKGCAHGYLTLTENTQVLYFVTHEYVPESERCYRYDDPAFNIDWGIDESLMTISEKDKSHSLIGDET